MISSLPKVCLALIPLLLTWHHIKAEELIPQELQWKEMVREQPATLSLAATGPYHAPANVVVVISIPYPETISRIDFLIGGESTVHLDHPILKEYEISLNNVVAGHYIITANVYDLEGKVRTVTTEYDVFPSNRYIRGFGNQNYCSSLITLDQEQGDFLDNIQDFSLLYGNNYPWFLRMTSEVNAPCLHVNDPALHPWTNQNTPSCFYANFLPVLNQQIVGGEPPMVAFGSSAKNGTPLFVNQDYQFGVIAGFPVTTGALKIEVYEKSDFDHGATNVAPVLTQISTLPNNNANRAAFDTLKNQFYIQDYHLTSNIHGKVVDFDTKVQYQFGDLSVKWGYGDLVIPLIVTHRSANDLFYYKVSFEGGVFDPNNLSHGTMMAFQIDAQGQHPAYNLTYALDFTQPDSWTSLFVHEPYFQDSVKPGDYQGKGLDELLHQTPSVQNTLTAPSGTQYQQLLALGSGN
jgi:hypothetical protein